MNKYIKLNQDIQVDLYNDIHCTGSADYRVSTNILNNSFFNNMQETLMIDILSSGTLNIYGGNKNIIINVVADITLEITEVNRDVNNYACSVVINVDQGSEVNYLVIDMNQNANVNRSANVLENSILNLSIAGLNKDSSNNLISIDLDGVGAVGNLKIITIAAKDTQSYYESRINNNMMDTKADIWQKAVVKSGGKNDFLATGFIKKGADNASNYQESRVLLLDDAALGNASPLLLIDHYNVVAGHAAGVSRVDEEELYYLQSRGIDRISAEHLMTLAFVRPLVDAIKDEELRNFVEGEIENIIFG